MTIARFAGSLIASTALLAACSQSDAPSEELGTAAEELVDSVLETPAPDASSALGPLAPRNDCRDLEGAAPFTAMLNAAIATRDTDVLVALAADDVKLGFGGDDGSANLRAALSGDDDYLWQALEQLPALGCAVNDQGGMTMPWYFAQDLQLDPFESFVVADDDAVLHEGPREDSPRVSILNWQEVEIRRGKDGRVLMDGNTEERAESWYGVRVPAQDGAEPLEGYVRATSLRSAIDYRLIAASRNGRWRITALLAGD